MSDLGKKVESALQGLNLKAPRIEVEDLDHSVIATVESGSFSGMDEAERQRIVWEALRESLTELERSAVEFVFTSAPDERELDEQAV